ncbi:DUF3173 domain-containing protein [Salipaludibacillus agaradhaerens]|jgi:hypothetical protein|nr:DUF3173 domain-containing protein [Salipaludibacillus agaradhaerens]
MLTINKREIMEQTGFTESVAGRIVREAKQIMVNDGYSFYANKRLNRVPVEVVNKMLAIELQGSEGYIGNVQAERKSMGVQN